MKKKFLTRGEGGGTLLLFDLHLCLRSFYWNKKMKIENFSSFSRLSRRSFEVYRKNKSKIRTIRFSQCLSCNENNIVGHNSPPSSFQKNLTQPLAWKRTGIFLFWPNIVYWHVSLVTENLCKRMIRRYLSSKWAEQMSIFWGGIYFLLVTTRKAFLSFGFAFSGYIVIFLHSFPLDFQ